MPELIPYHLSLRGGLHLGKGPDLEDSGISMPSDTLFGALMITWLQLGGDPEAFVRPFCDGAPPFLITSAFPYAGQVRFYPTPVDLRSLFANWAAISSKMRKKLRRVHFISESLMQYVLQGKPLDQWLFPEDEQTDPTTGLTLQGNTFWLLSSEVDQLPETLRKADGKAIPNWALRKAVIYVENRTPRVTIDRLNNASTIYHAGNVRLAEGCGLWFGVHWRDRKARLEPNGETFEKAFEQAMASLAHSGIGGERSSGYGAFSYQTGAMVQLPDPRPGAPGLLLSRYHPSRTELPQTLSADQAAYAIATVGGWLQTFSGAAQRRKTIALVTEGSRIYPPTWPAGDMVDLKPEYSNEAGMLPHPVYRYGYGLAAGCPDPGSKEADHA
ncbi:MAG TPA: type III-A CRISPR-associated RAMP protein Csm4 [Anaerolineaceae bacterium]|nr:type III-A CRISPR-associated RAMP protein Csm4 [Longilinea sp.]HNR45949.1 type III-A CRISPR-associated RAMP protein Csm4 [Anaerolineaceae bacterium]HNS37515.1 type III-A CRISPR-associated RAMP protein Csm4 [Anaerolineaceae bacterium]HOG80061.1 type III-A CRISPR-associated RAMP protein Csm4 [Anaerolineaceae bacterium]HQF62065.1 type III-A CRISPR-associated RAMP protein Csm4 [Anaerolineaceae bacterium]